MICLPRIEQYIDTATNEGPEQTFDRTYKISSEKSSSPLWSALTRTPNLSDQLPKLNKY